MGPADDACQSCWTLWRDAFAFVTWETFCKESNTNPKFQAKVDEAKASEGATEAPIRGGNVLGKNTFHIEVREAVELVTEQELKIALNTRVLPKHMRSIPLLRIPSRRVGAAAQTLAPEWEECYAFRDPEATRRKGAIVWATGVVATKMLLSQQKWNGHALAHWSAEVEATADATKGAHHGGGNDPGEVARCNAAGAEALRGAESSSEYGADEEEPYDDAAFEGNAATLGAAALPGVQPEDVSPREGVEFCWCLGVMVKT